jgi:cytochrome P450
MTTDDASSSSTPRPPGPKGLPLVGNYMTLAGGSNPIEVLTRAHAEYGDVVRFRFGPFEYWFVQDLDAIHRVLIENAKSYVKSRSYAGLKLVLGNGLVTSEGDLWKRQRKLISPAFTPRRIEQFVPTFVRCTRDMLATWDARLARDGVLRLDAHAAMMELTFRIVGLTLFSTELGVAGDQLGPLIEMLNHFANDYSNAAVRIPTWVPLPRNRAFHAAMRDLDALVRRIVDERRRRGELGNDLLGVLMAARDDESGVMTDAQLRDEMLTLLSAGHETTANALAWTIVLLSRHPEVEARVADEVKRVVGDRAIEASDLSRLEYTERVIQESMRVYPPVWGIERQNVDADVLCGYPLAPDTMIGIAPWLLHRDARYWPDPERFDPDRFLPDVAKSRPRLAYLPFGAGPRVCVGAGFAMLEAKAILATIVQSHRVRLTPTARIALDPAITLRPKYGIAASVERNGAR